MDENRMRRIGRRIYSQDSFRTITHARIECGLRGDSGIGSEHLMLGFLHPTETGPGRLLFAYGASLDAARQIAAELWPIPTVRRRFTGMAQSGDRALELALATATRVGSPQVMPMHLLIGVLDTEDGNAARILQPFGVDVEAVKRRLFGLR